VLAIAFFVFFNFEWLGRVISGRAALSGLLVAVMCTGAVSLWVAGNYFFNYRGRLTLKGKSWRLYGVWDMTKSGKYTLNDKTFSQLEELEDTLRIVVIGRAGRGEGPELDALLDRYREASDRVKLEYLVPTDEDWDRKRKALAEKLNKDPEELEWRSVALLYKDRFKHLYPMDFWEVRPQWRGGRMDRSRVFKGEEMITSAVYGLLDAKKTKIYFVTGHGERAPDDSRSGRGLSMAVALLKRSNIEWEKVRLVTLKEIPEDASVVVVCGPRKAISKSEVEVLKKYLDERKGRLLLCLDEFRPEEDLGLDELLAHVGLKAGRDMIVERDRGFIHAIYRNLFLAARLGYHPMVEKLSESSVLPMFSGARTISSLKEKKPDPRRGGDQGDYSTDALITGSEKSYGETDLATLRKTKRPSFEKDVDVEGPVNYAMASWEGAPPVPGARMQKKDLGRVVVVGDSDWCGNMLMQMAPDNRTFFMAAINWLAGKEKRITIEPQVDKNNPLTMKPGQRSLALIVLWTIPTGLLLAAGLVLWLRRR